MKKLLNLLLLLIFPAGMLLAQQADKGNGNQNVIMQEAQFKTHQMQEQLQLSDEQVSKVYQINLDYLTTLDAFGKNSSAYSDEIKNEKTKEIKETRFTALNDVLTVTQSKELKELEAGK